MAEQEQTFTIESYLRGKVRNIDITDDAMMSALVDAQVEPGTVAMEATDKQKDLALASIFIWIAGSPTRSQSIEDADGRWSHKEGGEQMSALAANRYLAMANELRKKWGLTAVANSQWGFKGSGFHDVCKVYRKMTVTTAASDDPNVDEDDTTQTVEKVLYEGKCRSYDHDTTSDKGEVITALRDLALPMKQDEWTADNAPKKGDFVEVNKGAFKEWGTVIDFRPNNLGTDILFRYDS